MKQIKYMFCMDYLGIKPTYRHVQLSSLDGRSDPEKKSGAALSKTHYGDAFATPSTRMQRPSNPSGNTSGLADNGFG